VLLPPKYIFSFWWKSFADAKVECIECIDDIIPKYICHVGWKSYAWRCYVDSKPGRIKTSKRSSTHFSLCVEALCRLQIDKIWRTSLTLDGIAGRNRTNIKRPQLLNVCRANKENTAGAIETIEAKHHNAQDICQHTYIYATQWNRMSNSCNDNYVQHCRFRTCLRHLSKYARGKGNNKGCRRRRERHWQILSYPVWPCRIQVSMPRSSPTRTCDVPCPWHTNQGIAEDIRQHQCYNKAQRGAPKIFTKVKHPIWNIFVEQPCAAPAL
jgi:hypothetical protein